MKKLHPGAKWQFRIAAYIILIFLGIFVTGWSFGFIGIFLINLPPMLYGITHNGIRFTIFWILISLTLSQKNRCLEL